MTPSRSNSALPDSAVAAVEVARPDPSTVRLRLSGNWVVRSGMAQAEDVLSKVADWDSVKRVVFEAEALENWDSALVVFVTAVKTTCDERGIEVDLEALPQGARNLVALSTAVPSRGERRTSEKSNFLEEIGTEVLAAWASLGEMIEFLGESTIALWAALRGRARFRRVDLLSVMQDCGPTALPIVTLVSVLIGMILAFLGAVQLQRFGAEIYVVNIVAVGMVRELGPMMTAIILAGRTGAAFAAQLGTMQVNEEISALQTVGISPMQFLVVPRMLALIVMMPLLVLYSNAIGILGGAVVAAGMLDISLTLYFDQVLTSLTLADWMTSVIKTAVFGMVVALAGCLRGMQCRRNAAAVGDAATSAVVIGIVMIIALDAVFTTIFTALGV